MKKTLMTIAAAAMLALNANAEGYQVNTLSAKQNGMGHTGVALKLGAESQIFNPAGMGWLDKKIDFSANVSPIFSYVTATLPDGKKYDTDNNAATPMSISAAFSIYENFKAGISFYTPYGSSINWTDNWPGAPLTQKVSLKVFTVQPTFSYRPIKNLSIGAGLMITWGNVDLNKALVSPTSYDMLVGLLRNPLIGQLPAETPLTGNVVPASVNLTGNAHPKLGVNIGVLYDINDKWSVGASFRSESKMEVKSGEASVNFSNEVTETILGSEIGVLNNAEFKAAMPACAIWNAGVSYKPIEKLTIAFDAQLTHWKAYDMLNISFPTLPQFNQSIKKNYHNSMTYHLGAEYNLTDRFDARLGLMIDTSPCDKDNYNPETPGQTRVEPSVGFSFRPIKNLSIDLSFIYVAGMGNKNCVGHYDDFIAKKYNAVLTQMGPAAGAMGLTPLPEDATFKADYKLHAFIPSIGISVNF